MQANKLPAARGWVWIQEGGRLWKRDPRLLVAIGSLILSTGLSTMVFGTIVGVLLSITVMPVLGLLIFFACEALDQKQQASIPALFARVTPFFLRIVGLGVIRTVALFGVTLLAVLLSGIEGATGLQPGQTPTNAQMLDVLGLLIWAFALATPIEMAAWFAPVLIARHDLPVLKAMLFSLVATWRNLRPLTVFMSTGLLLILVSVSLLNAIASAILPLLGVVVTVLAGVICVSLFHAAFYMSVTDVFAPARAPAEPEAVRE
ncbi:BPSS1780 family membrane protein [Uliginosibacterium sp. H1]|uniref:BPSS1780 family membrane protein n=1 Tax=Uliginosibacterium sp. H1 TaxID=3114757 RepID=UPI002E1964BF|nr:BPSS1780 family membrane protein [Uliginosibacterium sp. H1]